MILTLTLNPSLDRTVRIDQLERGSVNRTCEPVIEPGGKGVNITRVLTQHGVPSRAVLPVAGSEGHQLAGLLEAAEVPATCVPVHGHTRTNVAVVEPGGTVTKLNEPGTELTADDLAALATTVTAALADGDWLVVSGSLPAGLAPGDFGELLRMLARPGVSLAVDTSGPALAAAVALAPTVLKPNRDELAELTGRDLPTLRAVVDAARELCGRGVGTVLVTLGADGAAAVTADDTVIGTSRVPVVRSAVGAGDSFLAGFLAHRTRGEDLPGALRGALAWGAAAASLPGSTLPGAADLRHVEVTLEPYGSGDRPLTAA